MVQGTASSVGKSLIAAALCRIYTREGLRVLPFKSQNMSNNAVATLEGGEIGRAQALQAVACGVEPRVDMNPILLKPEGDTRSQVIVLGRPYKTLNAREYFFEKGILWKTATGALDRLRADCDLVVIEGAGSPAEINLNADEIVNMAIARYANSPVLLVGDINPGGVFAQFVGTLALLEPEERTLVRGLLVNKFRGDLGILEPGLVKLRNLTGLPILGVVPWMHEIGLAEEDGAILETGCLQDCVAPRSGSGMDIHRTVDIAVIRFPRIANFDDLDALSLESGVSLRFVSEVGQLGMPDAVVLPGTKATLADLDWLRKSGLDLGLRWLASIGRSVLGICGGFQMMGETIDDFKGIEGRPRSERGLGLLPVRTSFSAGKNVRRVRGRIAPGSPWSGGPDGDFSVEGYEIHTGESFINGPPLFELETTPDFGGLFCDEGRSSAANGEYDRFRLSVRGGQEAWQPDGTWAAGGKILGTYIHGLFDLPEFRRGWLASLGVAGRPGRGITLSHARNAAIDRLADVVSTAIDRDTLRRIADI